MKMELLIYNHGYETFEFDVSKLQEYFIDEVNF